MAQYRIYKIGFFTTDVEADSLSQAYDLAAQEESYDWDTWAQIDTVAAGDRDWKPMVLRVSALGGELEAR